MVFTLFLLPPFWIVFISIFSGLALVVIGLYVLVLPRAMRQIGEISRPALPEQVSGTEILLWRPASLVRTITRFGYLVLTRESLDFWAKDPLSREGERILSIPLDRVEVAVDKGMKKYAYGQRLKANFKDDEGKDVTVWFSFVRSWGLTWGIPGLDMDAVRLGRVLHDFGKAGEWAEAYVKAISQAKGGFELKSGTRGGPADSPTE